MPINLNEMSLKKKVSLIPKNPGIYFFKNKKNEIIYIGKAKNLKNRVRSYFNKSNQNTKNQIMISKASDLEYLVVNDEVEAIITEANMIKEYKPKYNIFLKDDKYFPYIMITNEPYPKVEIIRKKNLINDGNIYFGPYTDVNYLREVVKLLHKIFPIRTCSYYIDDLSIKNKKISLCLDYHINKCDGPCEGLVSERKYNSMIQNIIKFLKGKNKEIKDKTKSLMDEASKSLEYEKAAKYRNQLMALDVFCRNQKKIANDFNNYDILNVAIKDNDSIGFVMRVRNGLLIGREKFNIISSDLSYEKSVNSFLIQYYNTTFDIPSEIIINTALNDSDSIEKWLRSKKGKKVSILKPYRGNKKKMLTLCIKNSEILLKDIIIKKIKRKEYIPKTLSELKEILSMSVVPKHIEAFDNSNLQGTSAVAGMVCFINGKPLKKEYRRFNIKTVKGIDDFESMREIIFRRYSRQLKEQKVLPDLILIDGGKGQLSAAKSSLDKLGLGYITIIGLAKQLEEVYLPNSSSPQNISKVSPALYLLRKIRDEVHRYAISFHRTKRTKNTFKSVFNKISGLGPKRIKKIWDVYDSIADLKKDSIKNITNKTNIPIDIIKKVKSSI